MPQLFQVLRCYKCSVFQVHQAKKSNKWQCKLCGEKQSIKRHYGLGSSKECRMHVQKLNGIRGEIDKLNDSSSPNESMDEMTQTETIKLSNKNIEKKSRWTDFTTNNDSENSYERTDENNYPDSQEIISQLPNKRKRMRNYHKNKDKEQITVNLGNEYLDPTDGKKCFNYPLNRINEKKITSTSDCAKLRVNSHNESECQENEGFNNKCILKDSNLNHAKSQIKESKWKEFIENNETPFKIKDSKYTLNQRKTIEFSITDESDLDKILHV